MAEDIYHNDNTFKSGPPPFAGWWYTRHTFSNGTYLDGWRWWNNNYWSIMTLDIMQPEFVAAYANTQAMHYNDKLRWSSYWPEGARVPRINPDAPKVKPMRALNFFGGPGSGKSTISAGTFFMLKMLNRNVELIAEFAKEATWEKRHRKIFETQEYIFGKQSKRSRMAAGEVDFVITDSPLLMARTYIPKNYALPSLGQLILESHQEYENLNIFLKRTKPYNPIGRNQTEDEAKEKDLEIRQLLGELGISYHEIDYDEYAVDKILHILKDAEWI